ncbi:sirohydrochlorin chelatase [Neobacillus mesonae]|uniref:sirohydrochlorin chelatase n=1 Tax=Neobacillus mesonae TaxID=1193713 RepID=UPI00203D503B|nr:sirohydrochlorin chelatase [Neobacillus mesonae]MCM3570853.1 sirohydrochlorin chelatase [Neobacillus mesonae]
MKAILYIGHGTRSKTGVKEVKDFLERVIKRVNVPIQEISFLELTEPLIEDGFRRCVERGATEITVVPLFLLAAGHIKHDIPKALAKLQDRYPALQMEVKDPFGVQGRILDAVAELVRSVSSNLSPQNRLLIVGRGSSDPEIQADFSTIQAGLSLRLGLEQVSVCYLAAAEPKLQAGLNAILEKAPDTVIVVPYLLFSGLLSAEVNRAVLKWKKQGRQILVTEPLSKHQVIEDVVVEMASSGVPA